MSQLTPFLEELRQRLTLSDIAGRKVIWDARKSNAARGDFWAPCPFHQEKTPSFHVDDRKGFYYCFGCHAKGDMVSFVKETENLSFIEAVELLAREAGLEMPAQSRDPHAAEKRDRLGVLADVMEQAVRAYRLALNQAAGAPVRDYITGRGLTVETVKRFEMGYAPPDRHHLTSMFREKGQLDQAIDAGLVIKPDDGSSPYDRFRGRLMFPIRDPRGRCIAFGGRAMAEGARAKYLNSPETELFHKGRTLYHHGPAREAAGKTNALIVAEGYMDVIALAQAGFDHAVAPLGTAITEEQLGLLWRITDEPMVALDGDAAGLRAAERLVDLALPMLAPGKSLRFCLLPEGSDPDDLIKAGGPSAMKAALDESLPLVEMLFRTEARRDAIDTPEKKASFNKRLKDSIKKIPDIALRKYYTESVFDLWSAMFPRGRISGVADKGFVGRLGKNTRKDMFGARPETLSSELAKAITQASISESREATALLISLNNRDALQHLDVPLEEIDLSNREFEVIRDCLTSVLAMSEELHAYVHKKLGEDPVILLRKFPRARAHPYANGWRDKEIVIEAVEEIVAIQKAEAGWYDEMKDVAIDFRDAQKEDVSERLRAVNLERYRAYRRANADIEKVEEKSKIQEMIDAAVWERQR